MSPEDSDFAGSPGGDALCTFDGAPATDREITVGGRSVRVVRPLEPDRLLDDPAALARNRADDYMPYWAYLWPGAFLLAEVVGREGWEAGTRALEIGCGVGLAGLVGVASGLDVEFTDYDVAPLRFVEASLIANGFAGTTRLMDWREPSGGPYPVILGADVLYESRLIPMVCDLLGALLSSEGVALIGGPYRVATLGLEAALASRGLVAGVELLSVEVAGMPPARGTVHRVRRQG